MERAQTLMLCVVTIGTLFYPSNGCHFPTIFNFGDSNSDTGTYSATIERVSLPNGETFFGTPSGRFSDGRLKIDFIAEELGFPFLGPYVDAITPNFKHGANFAAAGATIQHANGTMIGTLYQIGARTFWIHNTGPIGCLPYFLIKFPPKLDDTDPIGCVKSYNEVALEFNKQLGERVSKLRTQLHGAVLIVVDIFKAKYTLISEADKYGFVDPLGSCCGHLGSCHGPPCSDPSKYISWDDVHYTEAANCWVANRIFDGSLSDPQIPLARACQDPQTCPASADTCL